MWKYICLVLVLSFCFLSIVNAQTDSLENQYELANQYLIKKDSIVTEKNRHIKTLFASLQLQKETGDLKKEFKLLLDITKEYEAFVYDSAFLYGGKAIKVAYQLKDPAKIAEAKSNISLILLLKGLYKETIDTLNTIDYKVLDQQKRVEFYSVAYRCYFDLANSRWGHYAPKYRKIGDSYVQKIKEEANPNSFEYLLALALQSQNRNENYDVLKYCNQLLNDNQLKAHQLAITNCILGISCLKLKDETKAKYHLLAAVINDVKSVTKETLAAKVLAELFFSRW